jgi:hypothetical protein
MLLLVLVRCSPFIGAIVGVLRSLFGTLDRVVGFHTYMTETFGHRQAYKSWVVNETSGVEHPN